METANHECYVSLEVAKLLKKAGFDWKCNGVFLSEDSAQYAFIKADAACDNNNSKYSPYNISAPTLEVAQRWLREVRREYVVVHPIVNKWFYSIHRPNFGHYYRDKKFSTYEEAQETGIKKALKLILEKGE